MVKLVVGYGAPENPAAFDEHYASTHVPLVHKIPNLRRFEAGKILGTPDGSPAPFYFLAELWFAASMSYRRRWEVLRARPPAPTSRRSPTAAPR